MKKKEKTKQFEGENAECNSNFFIRFNSIANKHAAKTFEIFFAKLSEMAFSSQISCEYFLLIK